jgi:hypothetical protein
MDPLGLDKSPGQCRQTGGRTDAEGPLAVRPVLAVARLGEQRHDISLLWYPFHELVQKRDVKCISHTKQHQFNPTAAATTRCCFSKSDQLKMYSGEK